MLAACVFVGQADSDSSKPAPADLKIEVARLIRQLDANALEERNAAEKALIEIGPPVLALLPQVDRRTPAEVKVRLDRILKAVETAAAETAVLATHVTLKGEMPLPEALAAMAEQTGNQVDNAAEYDATVNADFDNTPYWEALDKLLDQANLKINQYGGVPGELTLQARPDEEIANFGAAQYQGLFRFEPVVVEATRNLRNPATQGLRITMDVKWEPRLTPISLTQPLEELTVTDDQGNTLAPDANLNMLTPQIQSGVAGVEFVIPLGLPDRGVKQVSSLKGKLTALLPGRVEAFEFAEIDRARDAELRKAGVAVVLEQVRKLGDIYQVRMRVRFDEAANALESYRGWVFNNEAYIVDAQGNRLDHVGIETTRQEPTEVGLAYLFDLPSGPKGHKFVYKTPALILRIPVEYELKDIQLP